MTYTTLTIEQDDHGVATLSLNRPKYKNAQSRVMIDELDEAFASLDRDDEVGCILLRGEGSAFSAGHDLGTPDERADPRPKPETVGGKTVHSWSTYTATALRWRELQTPTVAAIHGPTVFAGWMVASIADVLLASSDAKVLPHLSECATLPWIIGSRNSRYVLLRNRMLTAREAQELGLVTRVVEPDDLLEEATQLARDIAENDRFLMRQVKQAHLMFDEVQGFRGWMRGSHHMHMMAVLDGSFAPKESDDGKRAKMGPVELAKSREDVAKAER